MVDGHDFVEEVAAKGAAAVIVEKEIQAPDGYDCHPGNGYPLCAGADVSCIFWISGGKIKGDRNYRNKGEDHDNLYDQVHFGECGHKVGLIGTIEAIIGEKISAANTTPESFTIHRYFAEMIKAGCDSVVMEVSSQGLMLHRTAGIPFKLEYLRISEKIISARMSIKISRITRDVRDCCSGSVTWELQMWMTNTLQRYLQEQPVKRKRSDFPEKADLRAVNTRLVFHPGISGGCLSRDRINGF